MYPPGYRTTEMRMARAAATMEKQAMVVEAMKKMEEERAVRVRQREEEKQ